MSVSKQEQDKTAPKKVIIETELDRLKRDVYRSDNEKFRLLMDMFRQNALLNKAKITQK